MRGAAWYSRYMLAVIAVVAAAQIVAAGQELGRFPAERWRPALDKTGVLNVESGLVLEPWQVDAALWADYANDPLALYRRTPDGLVRVGAIVGPRVGANAVVTLGLLPWLELGLDVPVVVFQTRGALPAEVALPPLAASGLGDVRLSPKAQLLHVADVGVDVAFLPTVTLPTSLPRGSYAGEKFFTFAPELAVSRAVLGVRFAGDAGYRVRSISSSGGITAGQELFYRAGMSLPLSTLGVSAPVSLDGSVDGAVTVLPKLGENAPFEALFGAHVDLGSSSSWQLYAAGGAGVLPGPGVPDFRVLLGVRFATDLKDRDGDGIDDDVDRCPDVPEDKDGIADGDGCPEDDADHDGINDFTDRCPELAEDKDGFEDADGCPDLDDDADGIPDKDDKCPRTPGLAELHGCPEPDTDGDRIVDRKDKCPTVAAPGTPDGCPLVAVADVPAPPDPKVVEVNEVSATVFAFGVASATLPKSTSAVFDHIADVLGRHPEITKVLIEGHTDDTGMHDENVTLSALRANGVKAALIARGVATSRLEVKGYGAARPIAAGTSPEARAKNRRVEITLPSLEKP